MALYHGWGLNKQHRDWFNKEVLAHNQSRLSGGLSSSSVLLIRLQYFKSIVFFSDRIEYFEPRKN